MDFFSRSWDLYFSGVFVWEGTALQLKNWEIFHHIHSLPLKRRLNLQNGTLCSSSRKSKLGSRQEKISSILLLVWVVWDENSYFFLRVSRVTKSSLFLEGLQQSAAKKNNRCIFLFSNPNHSFSYINVFHFERSFASNSKQLLKKRKKPIRLKVKTWWLNSSFCLAEVPKLIMKAFSSQRTEKLKIIRNFLQKLACGGKISDKKICT